MWDISLKVAFYVVTGLALILTSSWYVRSLYETITGRAEVVIAPIEIIDANGKVDKERGTALAHMLQARLHEIEDDIHGAQKQLMGKAPEGRAATAGGSATTVSSLPSLMGLTPTPIPQVLTQGVGLETRLLEPAQINVSVAGVEVGGAVAWMQRQMANRRTVVFTLYEKKRGVHIAGSLQALGLAEAAMSMDVSSEDSEDAVSLDRVVELMAYELVRRRMLSDPAGSQLKALSTEEFQSLVEVLRDTALQNRLVATRTNTLPEFKELLQKARKLSDSVKGWYQLTYLTASIAESANDWDAARENYEDAQKALANDPKNELRKTLEKKIAEMQDKLKAPPVVGGGQLTPQAELARQKMQSYAREATDFYNELLGQKLTAPAVKIQTDPNLKYSPYYDSQNVVAAEEVQYLPDLSFRNAAWQHIFNIAGDHAADKNDARADIVWAYANMFTILAQQHHLKQNEKTSDWVLGRGYIDWVGGKSLTKPYEGTPWASLKDPGNAYATSAVGKDRMVGHMRDYVNASSAERRYINDGILSKAFCLLAMKQDSARAAEIWIAALRELKKAKQIDFPRFAKILYQQAGDDREAVRESLKAVGLDPVPARAAAGQGQG